MRPDDWSQSELFEHSWTSETLKLFSQPTTINNNNIIRNNNIIINNGDHNHKYTEISRVH